MFLSGGQHDPYTGQTVSCPGHVHFYRLVLRMAQRSIGIRIVQIFKRFDRTPSKVEETGVVIHGPRTRFCKRNVDKVFGKRPPLQLYDAEIVLGTNYTLHETFSVQDQRY